MHYTHGSVCLLSWMWHLTQQWPRSRCHIQTHHGDMWTPCNSESYKPERKNKYGQLQQQKKQSELPDLSFFFSQMLIKTTWQRRQRGLLYSHNGGNIHWTCPWYKYSINIYMQISNSINAFTSSSPWAGLAVVALRRRTSRYMLPGVSVGWRCSWDNWKLRRCTSFYALFVVSYLVFEPTIARCLPFSESTTKKLVMEKKFKGEIKISCASAFKLWKVIV